MAVAVYSTIHSLVFSRGFLQVLLKLCIFVVCLVLFLYYSVTWVRFGGDSSVWGKETCFPKSINPWLNWGMQRKEKSMDFISLITGMYSKCSTYGARRDIKRVIVSKRLLRVPTPAGFKCCHRFIKCPLICQMVVSVALIHSCMMMSPRWSTPKLSLIYSRAGAETPSFCTESQEIRLWNVKPRMMWRRSSHLGSTLGCCRGAGCCCTLPFA